MTTTHLKVEWLFHPSNPEFDLTQLGKKINNWTTDIWFTVPTHGHIVLHAFFATEAGMEEQWDGTISAIAEAIKEYAQSPKVMVLISQIQQRTL